MVAAVVAAAIGTGWWLLRPETPAPSVTRSGTSSGATAPPAAAEPAVASTNAPPAAAKREEPEPPAAPALTADAAFTRLLAHGTQVVEITASAQSGAAGLPASHLRLSYRAVEPGYLYVIGKRPGSKDLTLFHPAPNAPARRAGLAGIIDIPAPAPEPSGMRLLLLLARESREPHRAGWTVRDGVRVRTFDGTSRPAEADPSLLGSPQCARAPSACDGAFGVTEVMQVTNVITAPSASPEAADRAAQSAAGQPKPDNAAPVSRPPKSAPPEAKPPSRRSAENSRECVDILQRISLGEPDPELIQRLKTLQCGS